jgi:hypothetical protein
MEPIKELTDPRYWNPKCKNFEIIDWDKFYSKNPAPPKVFDPPQRHQKLHGWRSSLMWWWNRSWICQPFPLLCPLPKSETARISDDSEILIQKMLGPNPSSENIPGALRNKLLWTENNIAPETLVSFNRWAWRTQTNQGRVIGLGTLWYDWSVNPGLFGWLIGNVLRKKFGAVQVSPDGKWINIASYSDPSEEGMVNYIHMYVVQEDDVFTTPDGQIIEHVKPGDLIRLSWNPEDPYECDNSKLVYMYFPRVVATFDERKGIVVRNDEHYGDLLTHATNDPDECLSTCCYTYTCGWSAERRFDFQVSYISDLQRFAVAAPPPEAEIIERL